MPLSPLFAAVIADLEARDRKGHETYRQPMTADSHADNLWEAYEEALDYLLYIRAEYERAQELVLRLREALKRRESGVLAALVHK